MGVDKGLINSQERLISACTNPGGLSSIFGTNVGHGGWFGIPVGHVQDGPAQLSFLITRRCIITLYSGLWSIWLKQHFLKNDLHIFIRNVFLTEKLPNVNTCPSMRRTAVWLLPAVTWTLGPGRVCTRVGEPLAGRGI